MTVKRQRWTISGRLTPMGLERHGDPEGNPAGKRQGHSRLEPNRIAESAA